MNRILRIIKYLGLIIITMLILIGITIITPIQISEYTETTQQLSSQDAPEHEPIKLDSYLSIADHLGKPISLDCEELYCVQPGTTILTYSKHPYNYHDILLFATYNSSPSSHGCSGHVPYYGSYSCTYYFCQNEHYTETSSITGKDGIYYENLYDIAFIISFVQDSSYPEEAWAPIKQQAIWQSQLVDQNAYNNAGKQDGAYAGAGANLLDAARHYKSFYEKILEVETNEDSDSYGKTGIKPNSLVDQDDIVLSVDETENIGKLGPFQIEYVDGYQWDGKYKTVAFGGISNMYLVDDNGTKVNIKNIIVRRMNVSTGTYENNVQIVKMYDIDSSDETEKRNAEQYTYFSNWDRPKEYYNENYIDYLAFEKAYPRSNDIFYVEFDLPDFEIVGSLKLHVEFSYVKCEMEICMRNAGRYYVDETHLGDYNYHTHTTYFWYISGYDEEGKPQYSKWYYDYGCHSCRGYEAIVEIKYQDQDGLSVEHADRTLVTEEYEIETGSAIRMKIGGYVFEDVATNKESLTNGKLDTGTDIMLKNIEVTLYEISGNTLKLATLATYEQEKNTGITTEDDYTRRINPTLTDENGYYEFRGVDATKNYVVKFTYNGQTYTPTEYLAGANGTTAYQVAANGQYSSEATSDIWNTTSKATELTSERNAYDSKFATIGSTPNNYTSSNSLGKLTSTYNEVYTVYELAGFTLNSNGEYTYNSNNQLIDTYLTLEDGKIIEGTTLTEGKINKLIREYIKINHKYPDLKNDIYTQIAGNNTTTWKKLQYIEDCKISAYTKNQSANTVSSFDQYPILDYFTTYVSAGNKYPNNSYLNGTYSNYTLNKNGLESEEIDPASLSRDWQSFGMMVVSKGTVEYKNIYEGQLYINCGLWRRQQTDIALQKDVYKATIKINGKTETYQYSKRNTDDFWEIQTRIEDKTYYGTTYNRALYPSDYNYNGNNKLEVYVTYKISIRNQSQSILTQIDEIVDYYDNTYTYVDNYSWIMYDEVNITADDYYNIMTDATKVGTNKFKNVNYSTGSKYSGTEYSLNGYNKIYVKGLSNTKLDSGEMAYIYLTFKVNEDGNKVNLGLKHNIAEINGYTTYYADNTKLPNGITKNSKDVAGIVDHDSKPGNFEAQGTLTDGTYEYTFEDDTDRVKGIKVYVDAELIRTISGTVWEDKRDTTVDGTDALIGNGIRDNKELTISGIKVEMIEILADGSEGIPAEKQTNSIETDSKGTYSFEGFIPGNYIIRFTYGGNVSATADGYNGQDYKSTTYQIGITQPEKTNLGNDSTYSGYINAESQNSTATYGYSMTNADATETNYSDAKDIWRYREKVNNYTSGSMTYEMANNLNNDKTIKDTNLTMVAETGVIAVEGEYNRINSDSDKANSGNADDTLNKNIIYKNGNDVNGTYNILNVDFGLQERPKAQLELNKQVSNVKIVLANQTVLFDANETVDNLIWQPKSVYDLTSKQTNNYYNTYNNYDNFRTSILERIVKNSAGLIQPTIDKELTHGATIQITYDITVTNVGEVDYNETSFYYTGKVANKNTIVKTSADLIVDYVENNLKYRDTENKTEWGWTVTTAKQLNNYVNSDVQAELKNYNTILTTKALNEKLIPATASKKGDSSTYAQAQLILTQTITAQNDNDDMVYNNIQEIVAITNDVGRRMAFSIQGNQKPSEIPQEPDASAAEKVVILPPFGETYMYFGLGIAVVALLATAVIVIKKKVLNK